MLSGRQIPSRTPGQSTPESDRSALPDTILMEEGAGFIFTVNSSRAAPKGLFGFQWGAMVLSRDQLGFPA